MTSTLTSLSGNVHHAPDRIDGTLCNGVGASRGQVRWFWRTGVVTCKGCLKAIAKAHEEAIVFDATFVPVLVVPVDEPVRTRRPQINHRVCSHPATPLARRACRKAQRKAQG